MNNASQLSFLGPGSIYLEQKIYHLTHDAFAEGLDIFLVPLAKDARGYTNESVFT